MPLSPSIFRLALVLLATAFASSLMPSLHAQGGGEPPPEVEDRRPKVRVRNLENSSFRGLTPAEAQEAQARYQKGRERENAGELKSALKAYKGVFKEFPRSSVAPEAYHRTAIVYVKLGNLPRAFEALDVILRAYPNYGHFNDLVSEQYRIAYEMIKGHRNKMFGVLPGFANKDRGIEYFERLIMNAPYSDYAPLSLMNIAEQHNLSDRPELAIDALDRLITNYPNSIVTSDAYLRLAQVHEKLVDGPLYDQSSTKESLNSYQDFLILFPRDPNVGEAEAGQARMKEMLAQSRLKIADFYYFKRSRFQAARVFYNEAITIAPTSESATLARERLAALEVDEAKIAAQIAADTERAGRKSRFFGLFKGDAEAADEAPGTGTTTAQPSGTPKEDEQPATTVTPSTGGK
ncbi:MAG: tetratricopeptide repeat protein [Opitutaceae bacterium]|nr:tetratricopeptide repeat protein [Opitutaceae bacterium]